MYAAPLTPFQPPKLIGQYMQSMAVPFVVSGTSASKALQLLLESSKDSV